ncbi:uncharacterized protein LOC128391088 [Panonychus citri]|uniref:uncharacterized protein LOC128391088 n=1 Tax=Panonychus citri TaxID=50023 RepID=UPI0023075C72|nr:uncharacterized protein LOC128391088 [Panonychus citri]
MVTQLGNATGQQKLMSSVATTTLKSNLSALNSSLVNQLSNLTLTTEPSVSSHQSISTTQKVANIIVSSSPSSVIDSNSTQIVKNLTDLLGPKVNITNSPVVTNLTTLQVDKNITNYANLTSSLTMEQPDLSTSTSDLSIMFIGLFSIMVCAAIIFLIVILVRKNRLDKLRHHLMPVYNFDPSEDGEDWETELLEEPFGSQNYGNESTKMTSIKLDSGLTGGLNIKGTTYTNGGTSGNGGGGKGRLTAASGLLSDNNNGNHSSRYLYTNEKPVV